MSGHILQPIDLYKFAIEKFKESIQFFYVNKAEVEGVTLDLKPRFEATKTVKGTQTFHKICPVAINVIRAFKTSDSEDYIEFRLAHDDIETDDVTISVGDYVACRYQGEFFVGIVDSYVEDFDDYCISFLTYEKSDIFFSDNTR